jgi:phosphonate metabolism protein PhnN/1,5-bisphosphokinase (PRPP-forming)
MVASGILVLVVGPSGAGKDTLMEGARAALVGDSRFVFVRREITRPAGAGGEDHVVVTADEFAARRDHYALSWEAHGLGYGIPCDIAAELEAGRIVIANVSRTVIPRAAARFPVLVMEITASPAVLAARLAARGREGAADQADRLARRVGLPEGVASVQIVNDTSVEAGVAAVLAALSRAAESGRPR